MTFLMPGDRFPHDGHLRPSLSVFMVSPEVKPMNRRAVIWTGVLSLAVLTGGVTIAQNINPARHPNLAAAQRLTDQAYNKIVAAQEANEWDMDGHAAKAKDLLDQANRELKAAAEAANRNHR
jgi:hypothetical protein